MKGKVLLQIDRLETRCISGIKKHPKLYVLSKCLQKLTKYDLYELICGYYEDRSDLSTIVLKRRGDLHPDRIVFVDDRQDKAGFYGALRNTLCMLNTANYLGFTPVVVWGEQSRYYDPGMDAVTKNAFEYYYEPVSDIPWTELSQCRTLAYTGNSNANFYFDRQIYWYTAGEPEIDFYAETYKRFIRLNDTTREYVDNSIEEIIGPKRTLGIHVRGTDFNQGFLYHPVALRAGEVIERVKDVISNGDYEQIFLATEDQRILEAFKKEFGGMLVYYDDVARSDCDVGPHSMELDRPLHHYKLGLEVIRDAHTLANCDGLICGLSQVSFAARYINRAEGKKYADLIVLNAGVNEDGRRHNLKKSILRDNKANGR